MIKFNDVISYNLKEFISPSDFSNVNHLRISKANSLEHELLKSIIFTKCVHAGINVLVEPLCLDKKTRPDILVLDTIPPIAYEIAITEKEISLNRKEEGYPFDIKIIRELK